MEANIKYSASPAAALWAQSTQADAKQLHYGKSHNASGVLQQQEQEQHIQDQSVGRSFTFSQWPWPWPGLATTDPSARNRSYASE